MYKNQLQELAQRSCFNLPSYSCIREGPDHAPRFKAVVNFNGDFFESPNFCTTLRQAEHSAAEVALHSLSSRAPSHSLAARILDETGVYKNLLQEISQRVGARLPSYTTFRSGLGHLPVFTCTVELAGIIFTGEPAKNKKQAEKNAAMAAWSSLKKLAKQESSSSTETAENNDEQEQITIARALLRYRLKEKMSSANNLESSPLPKKFPLQPEKKPSSMQSSSSTGSKILPLIRTSYSTQRIRPPSPSRPNDCEQPSPSAQPAENRVPFVRQVHKFHHPTGAAPYVPVRNYGSPSLYNHCGVAPPVAMRTAVPVFSAPPPNRQYQPIMSRQVRIAPPVQIRQTVPVFATAPVRTAQPVAIQVKQSSLVTPAAKDEIVSAVSAKEETASAKEETALAEVLVVSAKEEETALVISAKEEIAPAAIPSSKPFTAANVGVPEKGEFAEDVHTEAQEPLPTPALPVASTSVQTETADEEGEANSQQAIMIKNLKELEI